MERSPFRRALTSLWANFKSDNRSGAAARGKPDQKVDEAVN
jgi:hypothetical protein